MHITKYKTELNEKRHNVLVKESSCNYDTENLTNPKSIVTALNDLYGLNKMAEEYMYMIALTTNGTPLGIFEISHGTGDTTLISPREIFIRLLLVGANNFVLVHNHPSGDCTPSNSDFEATNRIRKCANMMNIFLLDHIIVGHGYLSFKENGLIS